MNPRLAILLENLDRTFDKRGWHGTTLRGSLRGVDADAALWRPQPDRCNVWEYALHAAYWKYIVRRKLSGDTKARFPRSPSNFPAVPESPTPAAWKADVGLLVREHELLRAEVANFSPSKLDRSAGEFSYQAMICGVAAHDMYHTGQIQLVKRLRAGGS